MKKLFFTILMLTMLCFFAGCSVAEEEILITSQNSPDENYTVLLYQVGSPEWSFGSVGAKLVLENKNGKIVDEVKFALANDGAGVFENNIKSITWMENQVEIIMGESDTTRQFTYVLKYNE